MQTMEEELTEEQKEQKMALLERLIEKFHENQNEMHVDYISDEDYQKIMQEKLQKPE